MCICLQHIGIHNQIIKDYQIVSESVPTNNELGTAIYIHNKVTFDKVNLPNAPFQMSATKINLPDNNNLTICNIYNQPNKNYNLDQLNYITNHIQQPLLLVGDFNAHHPLWDENCIRPDNSGNKIEAFLQNNNFCCLNEEETETYFSKTHGTLSSVDISICSTNIVDKFQWHVLDDLYTSDHFPIIISYLDQSPNIEIPKYNLNKADWNKYYLHTRNIQPFNNLIDHNEINSFIVEFMKNAANKSIPMITSHGTKRHVPWWSEKLSSLVKLKHSLGRRLDRLNKKFQQIKYNRLRNEQSIYKLVSLTITIKTIKPEYNKISAQFRKEVIQGRIISWNKYVSSITTSTPISQIWHKFRKINGSYTRPPRSPILFNGHRTHNKIEISNILGNHLASVSSVGNFDDYFKNHKKKWKKYI